MILSEFWAAPCVVMCPRQRSGKCRFPEDSQGAVPQMIMRTYSLVGENGEIQRTKVAFGPFGPKLKSEIRNPKKFQIRKSKSKMTALTPGPSPRTGEGRKAPSPPAPLPAGTMSGTVYPRSWSRRGEPAPSRFALNKSGRDNNPKQTGFWPRMARFRLILAPLPIPDCVTPEKAKPCVFPLFLAIFPERYPGRWGKQYHH